MHTRETTVKMDITKLTTLVGGPPSEHMAKVRALAADGNKAALVFVAAKTAHYGPLGHDCFDCGDFGDHMGLSGGRGPRYLCQGCGAGNCENHADDCPDCDGYSDPGFPCETCGGTTKVCGYCGDKLEDTDERFRGRPDENELIEHSLKHGWGEKDDGTWGRGGTAPAGSIAGSDCDECEGSGDCFCKSGDSDGNYFSTGSSSERTPKTQPVGKAEPDCAFCSGSGACSECDGEGKVRKTAAVEAFPVEVETPEIDRTPVLPDWVKAALPSEAVVASATPFAKTAGAADFGVTAVGKTAQEAFSQAVQDAQYESGHGGYSGTIAEKGSFRVFTPPKGVKPEQFIKGYHDFSELAYDANERYQQQTGNYDVQVPYDRIGDSRPDIKECLKCGAKYQAPPRGTRKPPEQRGYSAETMWAARGNSVKFKEEHPDFKTTFGSGVQAIAYDGPSPYKAELAAESERRMNSYTRNTPMSPREEQLRAMHKEHVQNAFHEAGGDQVYSPFREGVCHNCGHKPLRREKPIPVEHRRLYGQMLETYNDKWGDAVAVPLDKGRWHFMGLASE